MKLHVAAARRALDPLKLRNGHGHDIGLCPVIEDTDRFRVILNGGSFELEVPKEPFAIQSIEPNDPCGLRGPRWTGFIITAIVFERIESELHGLRVGLRAHDAIRGDLAGTLLLEHDGFRDRVVIKDLSR